MSYCHLFQNVHVTSKVTVTYSNCADRTRHYDPSYQRSALCTAFFNGHMYSSRAACILISINCGPEYVMSVVQLVSEEIESRYLLLSGEFVC